MLTSTNIVSEEDLTDTEYDELQRKSNEQRKLNKRKLYLNERINEKANISNGEVILMCMLLGARHSLTWEAIIDIINLVNKLFDKDVLNLSKFKLQNFFPVQCNSFTYHIYCPDCNYYIGNRTKLPDSLTCSSCSLLIEDIKKAPYFLTLNIEAQIKALLENPLV